MILESLFLLDSELYNFQTCLIIYISRLLEYIISCRGNQVYIPSKTTTNLLLFKQLITPFQLQQLMTPFQLQQLRPPSNSNS